MASGFNLTAQINLRGPSNIPQIIGDIRRQLGSINANVNFRLDPNAARNVTQLNANLQNFNRTLAQTATSANNAANAIRNLSNAIGRVNAGNLAQSLNAASSATARVSQSMTTVSRSVSAASSEMVEFGKQSGLAIRRFAAFSTVTGVVYGVTNAINQGIKAYIEYDKELVKLQQVTGQSAKGLQSLEQTITNLATNLGVGSNELTQISSTLAQAGLSARDTERALKALALSSLAPSFDSMNETVEGSIALMRQFGIGAGDLEKALGSVNSVAAKFAVEAADLITAIQRTGGVFATASKGVSEGTDALNEFLAVFTSVRATTRESAETIATGLRTIFTRIQREDTINALKEYGVNLTDLDGKFIGAYKAVEALSQGLSRLDPRDLKFSRIVEELGGFRQIGKVIPLIQQFATAQDALKIAQTGQGSLAADAAKAQESLAIQTSKVREEFLALFREIGKSDSFQTIVKGALSVTSALIKTADSIKGVLPILGVMLAFKGASAITQFGSGFIQGVRGSGGARGLGQRFGGGRSDGGEIRFSSGGLVPGYAEGDVVNAKLTPGEFVMRKSAVNSIGAANLSRMNTGGTIGQLKNMSKGSKYISQKQKEINSSNRGYIVNDTDMVLNPGIRRQKISLDDNDFLQLKTATLTPDRKQGDPKYIRGGIKRYQRMEWAEAFEKIVQRKIGANWQRTAETGRFGGSSSPIDLYLENNQDLQIGEIKFTGQNKSVSDLHILSKLLRFKLQKQDLSGFTKNPRDPVSVSPITVYEPANKEQFISWYRGANQIKKFSGGRISKFVEGGVAQRRVGYIDYDVIANPANENIVKQGMELTGITGPRLYTDHLTQLAINARKNSNLQKLRAIYGVAGSGKTTLARGQNTDKARLRNTERFPILTPSDIQRATEILLPISGISQRSLEDVFANTDRTYGLSSMTDREKAIIVANREQRDLTGIGQENRKPGSTTAAPKDSAVGEALLTDSLGDKFVPLTRRDTGQGYRRKRGNELVEIIKKKIGYTWGGFSPMTAGHESIMDAAKARGIPPEDFLFLVGANEGIKFGDVSSYRTAIFNQDARVLLAKAGAGKRGAMVLPKAADFEVPMGFDISGNTGRRKVLLPGKGSTVFVADKTSEQTEKYKDAGYKVASIERSGGISGTMVRDLIEQGNLTQLQQVLSPEVYDLISNNIGRIQNRARVLPDIVAEVQKKQTIKLADVEKAIKNIGITRIDKKKLSDPEYASKIQILEDLRKQRDKIKSSGAFEPYKLLDQLARSQPDKYALDFSSSPAPIAKPVRTITGKPQKANIGGIIQNFMAGSIGGVQPIEIDEALKTMGRAGLVDLAKRRGIPFDANILDPRKKLSPADQARRQSFLRQLTEAGVLQAANAANISRIAQSRSAAVVGITGDRSSIEMVTPGATDKDTGQSVRGVPVTLETGSLPAGVARRVQALIRNRVERIVADVGRELSQAAGMGKNKASRSDLRRITSKDLEDIAGSIFEKGLGVANLQYDEKSQSIDFPQGLRPELASMMGVTSGVMTDVTNRASKDTAKRKVREGQIDRGRLEARTRYGRSQFASGGLVPAMVSDGEAYVPPELAKSIGYAKLNRLNQADRNGMGGFANGGISIFRGPGTGTSDSIGPIGLPEGSFILRQKATEALGLYSGGVVQGFAGGSTVLPARPANPTVDNVRIPDNLLQNLQAIAKALTDVGLASSSSALLLRKNANITYREAERVIEADIRRMRVAGMSIENITAAETQLRETRRQGARSILTRQRFDGVSGDQLQRIENSAQASRSLAIQRARASGMSDDEINERGFQTRLTNTAYRQATQNVTGTAAGVGVSGNSIQQYIQQSMMDRRTLAQMDRQYVSERRQEIFNQLRAEQGVTATKAQIKQAASRALILAEQEVRERRQILNQLAINNGIAGPGKAGYTGIGTFGSAFGGLGNRIYTGAGNLYNNIASRGVMGNIAAGGRGLGRLAGGIGNSLAGQGGFFLSMGVGMLAGQGENIANMMGGDKKTKAGRGAAIEAGLGTVGAGLSLASGLAMIPGIGAPAAALTLVATAGLALKESFDASAKAVKEFDKSIRETKISDLNDKIAKDLEIFNKTGNSKDLMNSAGQIGRLSQDNLLINARDASAEKAKSQGLWSWMMGESKPILTVEDYRSLGKNAAKDNEGAAQAARAIVEKQIQEGRNLSDIVKDPGFAQIADTISRADPVFMTFVAQLKDSTEEERNKAISSELARRRLALTGDAAFVAAEKTRQAAKAMDDANKAAQKLTQTFESMARAFDQALGRFQFETERSMQMRESRNEDLTGKSRVSAIKSRDLNIIENPLAYDANTRRETSFRVARDIVGPDRPGLDPQERKRRQNEANLIGGVLNTDPVQLSNRLLGSVKQLTDNGQNFDAIKRSLSGDNLDNFLNNQGIPEIMKDVIKKQINGIISKISDDKNLSDTDKTKQLNEELQNTLGGGQITQPIKQLAIQFLKAKEDLGKFADALNKVNDLQSEANRLRTEAQNIRTETGVSLRQTISGGSIGLGERASIFNSQIAGLTGGTIDPTQIRQNIQNLSNRRLALQTRAENTNSDQERNNLQIEMAKLSVQINNNQNALEKLASSTELASAAMEQLQNAQRMQASRLQNIDQILSSTPQELQKFNESILRITQRSQGINPGPSRDAIRAYNQTLRQTGGNVRAAQMAGYSQMAQDRASDLQNMEKYRDTYILGMTNRQNPNTGRLYTQEEATLDYNRRAANTRGQMAKEMGADRMYGPGFMTGIMAGVDPTVDALGANAVQRFVAANQITARAKEEQALLNTISATEQFRAALATATKGFEDLQEIFAKIQGLQQKDLGINVVNGGMPQGQQRGAAPAPGRGGRAFATGGIVYASEGELINFQPRGTDTVPAMLTPGEFVINRAATQKHLPLLQAINDGVGGYSRGGVVYLQEGGMGGRPGMGLMLPRPQPLGVINGGFTSQFKQLDANGDMFLVMGEIDQNLITALDVNSDGRLSVAEFLGLTVNSDRNAGGIDWRLPASTVLRKPVLAADSNYMIYQTLRTEKYKNRYKSTSNTKDGYMRDPSQPVSMEDLDRAKDDPKNRNKILTGQPVRPGETDRSIPIAVRPSLVPGDPRSRGLDTEDLPVDNLGKPVDQNGIPLDPNRPFAGAIRMPNPATRNEFDRLPNIVPIAETEIGNPTTNRPKFVRLTSSEPNMDNFYRLDINQDGILSGNELAAYRRLDTDLDKKVDKDEWMGAGFDPYSEENKQKYGVGDVQSSYTVANDRKRRQLEVSIKNYEDSVASGKPIKDRRGNVLFDGTQETLDEKRKELSVLRAASGLYDTNAAQIRNQKNQDKATSARIGRVSYPVRKAYKDIETDRILFEEERRKIKEQNPDMDDAEILDRTVKAMSDQGSAYQGNDIEWWKRERGITSQAGSYDETGTLEAIKNSNDLGTTDDPTGSRARAEIDAYLASQGSRQQSDRVAKGRGEQPIDAGTAVIGTQGPASLVNELGDAQEVGRARSTIQMRARAEARKQAETEAAAREQALDTRDKELGIYTGDINRDIYVSGTGGVSYQPGMGSKISIEEQKNRRRAKFISSNLTFKDKTGKYEQSGTIDGVDTQKGTVRIAKIDPKTGLPLTRKSKEGNEEQVYTTVPIDQLDQKSAQKVNEFAKKEKAARTAEQDQQFDQMVSDSINIDGGDVVIPTDPSRVMSDAELAKFEQKVMRDAQISGDTILPTDSKPKVIIDPITRKPTDINGNPIDIAGMRKKIKQYEQDDFQAQLPPDPSINETRAELYEIESSLKEFEIARATRNAETEARYQELKKISETGRGLKSVKQAEEFARLSIERGVSAGNIPGGRTAAVETAMRNEAYAASVETDDFGQPLATSNLQNQQTRAFEQQLGLAKDSEGGEAVGVAAEQAVLPLLAGSAAMLAAPLVLPAAGIAATVGTIGLGVGASYGVGRAQSAVLEGTDYQKRADELAQNRPVETAVGRLLPGLLTANFGTGATSLSRDLGMRAVNAATESAFGAGIRLGTTGSIGTYADFAEDLAGGFVLPGANFTPIRSPKVRSGSRLAPNDPGLDAAIDYLSNYDMLGQPRPQELGPQPPTTEQAYEAWIESQSNAGQVPRKPDQPSLLARAGSLFRTGISYLDQVDADRQIKELQSMFPPVKDGEMVLENPQYVAAVKRLKEIGLDGTDASRAAFAESVAREKANSPGGKIAAQQAAFEEAAGREWLGKQGQSILDFMDPRNSPFLESIDNEFKDAVVRSDTAKARRKQAEIDTKNANQTRMDGEISLIRDSMMDRIKAAESRGADAAEIKAIRDEARAALKNQGLLGRATERFENAKKQKLEQKRRMDAQEAEQATIDMKNAFDNPESLTGSDLTPITTLYPKPQETATTAKTETIAQQTSEPSISTDDMLSLVTDPLSQTDITTKNYAIINRTEEDFAQRRANKTADPLSQGVTGWKFRLYPNDQQSQAIIESFIEKNTDALDGAKWQDDKWTLYAGDRTTLESLTTLAKTELLDTGIVKPDVEATDRSFNGFGARFDTRPMTGDSGATKLAEEITRIKINEGLTTETAQNIIYSQTGPEGSVGGIPTTGRAQELLRMRRLLPDTDTDSNKQKATILDAKIQKELDIADRALSSVFPDIYGSPINSAENSVRATQDNIGEAIDVPSGLLDDISPTKRKTPISAAELASHPLSKALIGSGHSPEKAASLMEAQRALYGPLVQSSEELIEKLGGRKVVSATNVAAIEKMSLEQAQVADLGSRSWGGSKKAENVTMKDYRHHSTSGGAVGPWDSSRVIEMTAGIDSTNRKKTREKGFYTFGGSNIDELSQIYFDPEARDFRGSDIPNAAQRLAMLTQIENDIASGNTPAKQRKAPEIPKAADLSQEKIKEMAGVANKEPKKMYRGGIVYASNGALIAAQQVGTDSVPAMLTPGEFVVNREASQRYMPVLNAINKGYYNQGGIVQYLASGGIVAPQYLADGGMGGVSKAANIGLGSVGGPNVESLIKAGETVKNMLNEAAQAVTQSLSAAGTEAASQLGKAASDLATSATTLSAWEPGTVNVNQTVSKTVSVNGVSQEWNKYEGSILAMAGENSKTQDNEKERERAKSSETIPPSAGRPIA